MPEHKKHSPKLDESLVNQQCDEISRQVVPFSRQQQNSIISFRPELDVDLWIRGRYGIYSLYTAMLWIRSLSMNERLG